MSEEVVEFESQIKDLENILTSADPQGADEHIFFGQIHGQLAEICLDIWRLTANDEDFAKAEEALSKSIEFGRAGAKMAASNSEHDQVGEFWAFAAQQANSKFTMFSDLAALDQAIDCYSHAIQALESGSQTNAAALLNLANCLVDRFENQESVDQSTKDIDDAIEKGQQAMSALSGDPTVLNDVSTMFLTRFEKIGKPADLKSATDMAEEALGKTDPNDPSAANRGLNYANCLRHHYERSGDRKHLDKAIELLVAAKTRASSTPGFPKAKILSNLAQVLHLRYEALGTNPDLFDAINNALAAEKAVREEGDALALPVILSNLASYQHAYFQANPEPESLDHAITTARLALEGLKDNPARRSMCLYNLASMLADKSEVESDGATVERIKYLDEAIVFVEESTQVKNIDRSLVAMQNDLWSRLLQARYELSSCEDEHALETAILKGKAAVDASSELPRYRGDFLVQLGDVLKLKYDKHQDDESFSAALSAFFECAEMQSAPDLARTHACHRAALLHQSKGQWEDAVKFAETAVNMLPKLALNTLERDSQQRVLEWLSSLSGLAAALALKAGWTAGKAFELLEAGRGIISRRTVGFDPGLAVSNLESKCHELLETYQHLRQKIGAPLTSGWLAAGYPSALTNKISQRVKDVECVAQLEEKLRTEYGVDLLSHLTEKELVEVASKSPIVAFVVNDIRSDALIVTASGIQNLELPGLRVKDCAQHYMTMQMPNQGTLRDLNFESFYEVNEKMKKLLVWLWDIAVLPVLKHLDVYSTQKPKPSAELPRIHWVTSGILGLMPLHAAGHHDESSTENALSHAVSSYTTTVASLRQSIDKAEAGAWKDRTSQLKVVTIGMPESPDPWGNFDCMDKHLEAIKQIAPDESNRTYLKKPTSAAALAAISATQVAHFVCHGVSQRDPSSSSLTLCRQVQSEDGQCPEVVVDPLMVRQIASQVRQNSILAFFAACQTADNAATGLVDESIHIVSAFQLLGYANVIGTLWEVEEMASASFANEFYASLARRTQTSDNSGGAKDVVARAFHDAMLLVRQEDPEYPVTWATMVCFGA